MTKNRSFTGKGIRLDQNDKEYLSRQMTTDFANRIPVEILSTETIAQASFLAYIVSWANQFFNLFQKKDSTVG